jgi:hypothetical protein
MIVPAPRKPDAAHHLGGDARRVADPLPVHETDAVRDVHQQRGAETDEDVGAEAGRLSRELALEADDAAEEDRERELDEEVEAQDARDLHHLGNVVLRRRMRMAGSRPPSAIACRGRARRPRVVSGELSP